MKLQWGKWFYGLVAGVVGGGANSVIAGVSANIIEPQAFNIHGKLGHMAELILATFVLSALIHFFTYLSQHPVPEPVQTQNISGGASADTAH